MSHCIDVQGHLICPGDPVRVAGKHGLWRYIAAKGDHAEVVGAYSPSGDPHRTQEVARFFLRSELRYDRHATREQVMQHPELKTWRRR